MGYVKVAANCQFKLGISFDKSHFKEVNLIQIKIKYLQCQ